MPETIIEMFWNSRREVKDHTKIPFIFFEKLNVLNDEVKSNWQT
jgi:hypothetical protein